MCIASVNVAPMNNFFTHFNLAELQTTDIMVIILLFNIFLDLDVNNLCIYIYEYKWVGTYTYTYIMLHKSCL